MATVTVIGMKRVVTMFKDIKGYSLISYSLNRGMKDYRRKLVDKIKAVYATRYSKTAIDRLILSHRATKKNPQASLEIRYKANPLATFQVDQVAIGKRGTMKRVTWSRKNLTFNTSIGKGKAYTKVRVIRGQPRMKLVVYKQRYKGFLQAKKRQIYARKQKATWYGKVRAPYRPLYGLAIAQMARAKRVQDGTLDKFMETRISTIYKEALSKTFR